MSASLVAKHVPPLCLFVKIISHQIIAVSHGLNLDSALPDLSLNPFNLFKQRLLIFHAILVSLEGLTSRHLLPTAFNPADPPQTEARLQRGPRQGCVLKRVIILAWVAELGKLRKRRIEVSDEFRVVQY